MAHTSRNQMIERADEFRTLANQRRARGHHHGASAKGWDWKRPELDRSSFADVARLAWRGWRSAAGEARNDFAAACLNGKGSDVYDCEIPF